MKQRQRGRRGAALMTAVMMMGTLLVMVVSLLMYANQQRVRAIIVSRAQIRGSCAQAGLQFARGYFGRNQPKWDTYLANPGTYNPIPSSSHTTAAIALQASIKTPSFQAANPALFTDLDNDSLNDVYIYVRDNEDEKPASDANFAGDTDRNVIVGAVCISNTLVPRAADGSVPRDSLVLEGLLTFNAPGSTYSAQAANGASGDGNANR